MTLRGHISISKHHNNFIHKTFLYSPLQSISRYNILLQILDHGNQNKLGFDKKVSINYLILYDKINYHIIYIHYLELMEEYRKHSCVNPKGIKES